MKYMVIESFTMGKTGKVYERYNVYGRMLPDGLKYIDSWLTIDRSQCFQIMETDNIKLIDSWIAK